MISAQRRGSTIVPVAENEEMILTDAQYQAFQEAFELFDKNGGGTIDAAELQKTLDDCGIYVNGEDLGKTTLFELDSYRMNHRNDRYSLNIIQSK